jgi:hypothetical protein
MRAGTASTDFTSLEGVRPISSRRDRLGLVTPSRTSRIRRLPGGAKVNPEEVERVFQIERGPFIVAAALFGVGGLIMFIAMALGSKAAIEHSRRFVQDPSVGDFAKSKWSQIMAAGLAASQAGAQAGADAWRKTGAAVDDLG